MTELETYQHILIVASTLIAEKGFAKTSMNDIVKATGLSKGGVYWHFKSKDDIILAIIEGIFTEQMQFLDTVLTGEGRAVERFITLIEMIAGSLNGLTENTPSPIDVYALAMRQPELLAYIKQYYERYLAHFVRLIEQGIQEGDFQVDNAKRSAFIFMSSIEGIILVNSVTQQADNLADTLNEATQIFLKGIQKHKGD